MDDAGTGTRSILRVHRQNYHLAHEIESELDWLDALRRDSDVTVPTVLPASDGRRVVTVNVDGTPRYVVHFEMVAGVEPDEASVTVEDFHTLGWITAVLHRAFARLDASVRVQQILLGLGAQPRRRAALGPLAGRRRRRQAGK